MHQLGPANPKCDMHNALKKSMIENYKVESPSGLKFADTYIQLRYKLTYNCVDL